jgi:hypothetical protein
MITLVSDVVTIATAGDRVKRNPIGATVGLDLLFVGYKDGMIIAEDSGGKQFESYGLSASPRRLLPINASCLMAFVDHFSPNGYVIKLSDATEWRTLPGGGAGFMMVRVSRDGRWLAAHDGKIVHLWDLTTLRPIGWLANLKDDGWIAANGSGYAASDGAEASLVVEIGSRNWPASAVDVLRAKFARPSGIDFVSSPPASGKSDALPAVKLDAR